LRKRGGDAGFGRGAEAGVRAGLGTQERKLTVYGGTAEREYTLSVTFEFDEAPPPEDEPFLQYFNFRRKDNPHVVEHDPVCSVLDGDGLVTVMVGLPNEPADYRMVADFSVYVEDGGENAVWISGNVVERTKLVSGVTKFEFGGLGKTEWEWVLEVVGFGKRDRYTLRVAFVLQDPSPPPKAYFRFLMSDLPWKGNGNNNSHFAEDADGVFTDVGTIDVTVRIRDKRFEEWDRYGLRPCFDFGFPDETITINGGTVFKTGEISKAFRIPKDFGLPLVVYSAGVKVAQYTLNVTVERSRELDYEPITVGGVQGWTVVGRGDVTGTRIEIPDLHLGLPVLEVGDEAFFEDDGIETVVIGDRVTKIGTREFSGGVKNSKIVTVTIGNSVKEIGSFAFVGTGNLKAIVIPNSVVSLGSWAFQDCRLESVVIGSGITEIGEYAFSSNLLESVTIPDTVRSIGDLAFAGNRLVNVVIPDSVVSIGAQAFRDNRLESVGIPGSVQTVGDYAFYENDTTLTSVTIPFANLAAADSVWESNGL